MNHKSILALVLCIAGLTACGADESEKPAAPAAAGPAAKSPAAPPASAPAVLATVGGVAITRDQVEGPLKSAPAGLPPQYLAAAKERILDGLIIGELMHAYIAGNKIPCDPNDLADIHKRVAAEAANQNLKPAEWMKSVGLTEQRLRDQACLRGLTRRTAGEKQVDAFVKAHPAYFNGTKVQASHILIACKPTAPSKQQLAAVAKLKQIKADIAAGKTTFANAAKTHSACPSGKQAGGDLGEFTFEKMVPTFSLAAFEMKVGEISDIVRTQFGFHVIQVTKRTDGQGAPAPDAREAARRALLARLESSIFDQALTSCPIVLNP